MTQFTAGPDDHLEFGTIGVDDAGSLGIVGTSAGARANLSVLLWTRRREDPANTFTGPPTIVAGAHPYTCANDRKVSPMRNSAGILTALDPVDRQTLWATQQRYRPLRLEHAYHRYKVAPEKR